MQDLRNHYFAAVPGWIDELGSRSEKPPSSFERAKSIPLDSNPRIILGSRLVTNIHVLPTRTAGSGKYTDIPETIWRGFALPCSSFSLKSTESLRSLSVSGIFSADRILPARIS